MGRIGLTCAALVALALVPAFGTAERDEAQLPGLVHPDIQSLVERGRADEALRQLERLAATDGEAALDVALIKARAAEAAGDRSGAVDAWQQVAVREPGLADAATRHTVRLLVALGQIDQAQLAAGTTAAALAARADLTLDVADAWRAAARWPEAGSLYRLVLAGQADGSVADRAREGLARTLEAQGSADEALTLWHEVLVRFRRAETYVAARRGRARVAQQLGRTPPPLTETQYDALASRLSERSRFLDAIDVLDEWRQEHPSSTRLVDMAAARVTALYNLRRNREAGEAALELERGPAPRAVADRMRLLRFRLAVREGRADEAARLGMALWDDPQVASGVRFAAASLLSNYLTSLGRTDDALSLYTQVFGATRSASDARDILLRAGVAAIRARQHGRAAINLEGLLKRGPLGDTATAARFWLGVARHDGGDTTAAIDALAAIEQEQQYAYYGLRATARLDQWKRRAPGEARAVDAARARQAPPAVFPPLTLDSAGSNESLRLAGLLARTGHVVDAAAEYRRAAAAGRSSLALQLLAARAAAAAGEHRRAVAIVTTHFGSYLQRQTDGAPVDLVALAFPRPFWEEVRGAATESEVDPTLLVALMRRESRFDPDARSAVGALGLFQIMPYTAAGLAPALGVDASSPADILQPRLNAQIAAALLRRIRALFGDALSPAIAAYNAGEDRVTDWWTASKDLPDDLFVELIPYSETRGFVREVFANYHTYERVYGR
jgi:soluble lytic murein transglycosylase-like protein